MFESSLHLPPEIRAGLEHYSVKLVQQQWKCCQHQNVLCKTWGNIYIQPLEDRSALKPRLNICYKSIERRIKCKYLSRITHLKTVIGSLIPMIFKFQTLCAHKLLFWMMFSWFLHFFLPFAVNHNHNSCETSLLSSTCTIVKDLSAAPLFHDAELQGIYNAISWILCRIPT